MRPFLSILKHFMKGVKVHFRVNFIRIMCSKSCKAVVIHNVISGPRTEAQEMFIEEPDRKMSAYGKNK